MAVSQVGDAGDAVRSDVRRPVDGGDDEDGAGKGGRRFKQAGTPNLHLVIPFPVWRTHSEGRRHSFLFGLSFACASWLEGATARSGRTIMRTASGGQGAPSAPLSARAPARRAPRRAKA